MIVDTYLGLKKPLHFEEIVSGQPENSMDFKEYAAVIKTALYNVKLLNILLEDPETDENNVKIDEIVGIFHTILPKLHSMQFFDFIKPSELLDYSENMGRTILVIEYLKEYFNDLSEEEQDILLPVLESLTEEEEEDE